PETEQRLTTFFVDGLEDVAHEGRVHSTSAMGRKDRDERHAGHREPARGDGDIDGIDARAADERGAVEGADRAVELQESRVERGELRTDLVGERDGQRADP